ncbi:MAG: leucine-rich repeat protein [Candidatus Thorarchaeota archaeon]
MNREYIIFSFIVLVSVFCAFFFWITMVNLGIVDSGYYALIVFGLTFIGLGYGWLTIPFEYNRWRSRRKTSAKPLDEVAEIILEIRTKSGEWEERSFGIEERVLNLQMMKLTGIDLSPLSDRQDIDRIDLSMNSIEEIDLSPLTTCTNLREFLLHSNNLVEINLSPLSSCTMLEYLDICITKLSRIDLRPLSSCTKLEALNMGTNRTGEIDLTPLSTCTRLKILTIEDMNLETIDLNPLRDCEELEFLKVNDNKIKSLDISPIFGCRKLDLLEIDRIELTLESAVANGEWSRGLYKHRKRVRIV